MQNSRYISKDIFETMMAELGFTISRFSRGYRDHYYLFDWNGIVKPMAHPKKQICDGAGHCNFCMSSGDRKSILPYLIQITPMPTVASLFWNLCNTLDERKNFNT